MARTSNGITTDWNHPTFFSGQPLKDLSPLGRPQSLHIVNDLGWEGPVVEAPTMEKHHGRYFLFYSGNWFFTPQYGIGYAVCATPVGPCDKPKGGAERLLRSGGGLDGPGHQSVFTVGGRTFIAYHALAPGSRHTPQDDRWLYIRALRWRCGRPYVDPPAGAEALSAARPACGQAPATARGPGATVRRSAFALRFATGAPHRVHKNVVHAGRRVIDLRPARP